MTLLWLHSRPRGPSDMGARFRAAAAVVAVVLVAFGVSCGPGVQAVYEGSIRFEHCYRLDLDARIAPSHRMACWSEWLREYTYGQRKDRLDYARERVDALASGESATDQLAVGREQPLEREFYVSMPAPTSAYAPPPPISPPPSEAKPPPPGQACTLDCETAWRTCGKTCSPEAASDSKPAPNQKAAPNQKGSAQGAPAAASENPCARCETTYKSCVKDCFDDGS